MKNDLLKFPSKMSCCLLAMLAISCNPAMKPPKDIGNGITNEALENYSPVPPTTSIETQSSISRRTDESIGVREGAHSVSTDSQADTTQESAEALAQNDSTASVSSPTNQEGSSTIQPEATAPPTTPTEPSEPPTNTSNSPPQETPPPATTPPPTRSPAPRRPSSPPWWVGVFTAGPYG
ncbi:hypothetical protein PVA45_05280 [Entomospira entomophila]|uniref:Uncharacterized protein n=1 Tax=Entomospira entomophila TaxID=2719988 RepID=A0A968GA94_9SPIO|nr:hypothetical protein [Entomospira entomophilus]NIZ40911.1 hypothetical protein [Entomospira entomophilus]WDI35124.1 hypothetical protein PVA45_05280 [Entomospira entomophilus]